MSDFSQAAKSLEDFIRSTIAEAVKAAGTPSTSTPVVETPVVTTPVVTTPVVSQYANIPMGMNGHEGREVSYPAAGMEARIKLLAANNLLHYRTDVSTSYLDNTTEFNRLVNLCVANGVTLRPMIYPTTEALGYKYAKLYGDRVKVWEIGNEVDLKGTAGAPAIVDQMVATYKGMKKASDELGLGLKFTVNVTATNTRNKTNAAYGDAAGATWFLDLCVSKGFKFDYVSFHYYPHKGDKGDWMNLYMAQVAAYAKRTGAGVFLNEFNVGEIYDGSTGAETVCVESLRLSLGEFNASFKDVIKEITVYEFLDEPNQGGVEANFGVRKDLATKKATWDVITEFALAKKTDTSTPVVTTPVTETTTPVTDTGVYKINDYTNDDWDNGVLKKTYKAFTAPNNDRFVAGMVLQLSNSQAVNVLSVNKGAKDSTIVVDQTLDPKAMGGKTFTIKKMPTAGTVPVSTGSDSTDSSVVSGLDLSWIAKAGTLKQEGSVVGVNHGQPGGGETVLPGKVGTNYAFASEANIQRWAARGLKRVRVSILWERIQRNIGGEIDATYGQQLVDNLKLYAKYGIKVLLCQAHNYGGYSGTNTAADRIKLGTTQVPQGSLADLSGKLVTFLKKHATAFSALYGIDLMNEPVGLASINVIFKEYQLCIDAIRKVDSTLKIAVESYEWATTASFIGNGNSILGDLVDPAGKLEIHTHLYLDGNAGGGYTDGEIKDVMIGVTRLKAVAEWAKSKGIKLALGEHGAPGWLLNDLKGVHNVLSYCAANGIDVYGWWATEYATDNIMSLEATRNAPMVAVFNQFI